MSLEYQNPRYLSEVYELLDSKPHEVEFCAGGTHLLRFYPKFPQDLDPQTKTIVHIGDLAALSECREEAGRYLIGATTRISHLVDDYFIQRYLPAIVEAAQTTSTPQIRNRRTIGGEIAWGNYHSGLIATLLALGARLRVRLAGENGEPGQEQTLELSDFYYEKFERAGPDGKMFLTRAPKVNRKTLILKVVLPEENFKRTGSFNFFRKLNPKISIENSGVVVAVRGTIKSGIITEAKMVASGLWMWGMEHDLPLEGIKASEHHVYEKLYSFCDRFNFDSYRREEGPSGNQLGLILFGLLKEGFRNFLPIG